MYTSELPGMPLDPAAVESSTGERSCVVLIKWDPPSNIASPNINHYVINTYGNSDIPTTNATTTLATFLSPCNDLSDIDISVAAVDRCERMGMSTRNFTPNELSTIPPTPNTVTTPSELLFTMSYKFTSITVYTKTTGSPYTYNTF